MTVQAAIHSGDSREFRSLEPEKILNGSTRQGKYRRARGASQGRAVPKVRLALGSRRGLAGTFPVAWSRLGEWREKASQGARWPLSLIARACPCAEIRWPVVRRGRVFARVRQILLAGAKWPKECTRGCWYSVAAIFCVLLTMAGATASGRAGSSGAPQLTRFQEWHRKWKGSIALWLSDHEQLARLQRKTGLLQQRVTGVCNRFLQQLPHKGSPL